MLIKNGLPPEKRNLKEKFLETNKYWVFPKI